MYSVLIRPLNEQDALVSCEWRNNPEIWKYTGRKPDRHITRQIETEWLKNVLAEDNSFRFAIMADSIYIGNIQITDVKSREHGEYHIFIGNKSYWGKGIGTLATAQLIRFAKEILQLRKLYLFVDPQNEAAIRVYQKSGFVRVSDEIKMVYDLSPDLSPRVSVFMMAYNHEPYIQQSIESIIFQKTDFDFDIVIGEDCSTDNTRDLIKRIAGEYPGKFVLLFHTINLGPHANQIAVFNACKGEYIAMCEGDDYWMDPYKLNNQTAYLNKHPGTGMVCTNYRKYYELEGRYQNNCFNIKRYEKQVKFTDYILDQSSISTATVMLRNRILREYFSEVAEEMRNSFIVGDTPLWLFIAAKSHIAVFKEETAVYRILDSSACHFTDPEQHYRFVLKGFEMADYFYTRYGNNDKVLLERLNRKKHRAALFHGYRTMNSSMAWDAFMLMRAHTSTLRQRVSAWIMLAGAQNRLFHNIASSFLKHNKSFTSSEPLKGKTK